MALSDSRWSRTGLVAGATLIAALAWTTTDRAFAATGTSKAADAAIPIGRIDPPEQGFFSRVLMSDGIPIKAHKDVSDAAMREAARRINRLLKDVPVVRRNLAAQGAEHHIIGKDQATSDLPEWRHMKGKMHWDNSALFDDRVRGMGGLVSSSGEENLLKLPTDRYKDHRDICSHEFSHGILGSGVSQDVVEKVEAQFRKAKAKGLWPSYAGVNAHEYFAELTMWYIGSRGDYGSIRPAPQPGPEWLKRYDPEGYALIDDFYRGRIKVQPLPLEILQAMKDPIAPEVPEGPARRRTSILVTNDSGAPVKVFNVEAAGGRTHIMDVPPGARYAEDARAGQVWLVTRESGAVLGYYRCTRERGHIVINAQTPPTAGQDNEPDTRPVAGRSLSFSLRGQDRLVALPLFIRSIRPRSAVNWRASDVPAWQAGTGIATHVAGRGPMVSRRELEP